MCALCVRAITPRVGGNRGNHLPRTWSTRRYGWRMPRRRADTLLAERGLAPSRTAAAATVRAGRVKHAKDGSIVEKPSELVDEKADLLVEEGEEFVSRGGIKLKNAL